MSRFKKLDENMKAYYNTGLIISKYAVIFLLLISCTLNLASSKAKGEYIINIEDDIQNENVVFNNTTITNDHIELLSGWNPSNKWWGTSGGSIEKLDATSKKFSICFTAPATLNVSSIGVVSYGSENSPAYKIGLQLDDGYGNPDGYYVSGEYGIIKPTENNQLYYGNFSNNVMIKKGQIYHIVVEYHDGLIDSSHYARLKSMNNGQSEPIGWIAYNYKGYDPDIAYKDPNFRAIFSDGYSWKDLNRNSPNFVLNFENGEHFGGLQLHNYRGVYGNIFAGERILIHTQNKTVNQISSYFWSEKTVDSTPNDNLYYEIQDINHSVLRSGILIDKRKFDTEPTQWWTANLSTPIELEVEKTYYIIFKSPKSNSTSYYNHDASGPIYHPDWTIDTTYGGKDSYCVRSLDGGLSWTNYLKNDYSFGLKLCDVSIGEAIINTDSINSPNEVWKQIKLNGSIPKGTSLDIYVKSSAGNGNFSTWNIVEKNAKNDVIYGIPTIDQNKYISIKLVLKTNSPSVTPKIYDIFLYTGDNLSYSNDYPNGDVNKDGIVNF